VLIAISEIRQEGSTQSRAAIDPATLQDYADAMRAGATFPPVTMFHDGEAYWLADGFHRVRAAFAAALKTIEADVRQGARRDAVLHSVSANAQHGLRRTNDDKRRAVLTLLGDPEWGGVERSGGRPALPP
jgi:ParB-like chromosome segregation protein Spo0J